MPSEIRICVMRDGPCPHGIDCPYVGDSYSGYPCKDGWQERRPAPARAVETGVDAEIFTTLIARLAAAEAEIERLKAELNESYFDEPTGITWHRPTAWAYFAACRALIRKQAQDIMTLGALVYDEHAVAWKDRCTALLADRERMEKALGDERTAIAEKARAIAAFYEAGSDGRNTFILHAEWIEARSVPSDIAERVRRRDRT